MAAAYHSFRSFREYYNAPPPTPKGMPVNSRVPLEVCRWFFTWVKRNKVEKSLLPREKTRWGGLNTDETNKVMRLEKINRLQGNPVLWVLTWAQGLRCEVCHFKTYPECQCVVKRCMYAMQHFYRYSRKPTIRLMCHSTSFTYRT